MSEQAERCVECGRRLAERGRASCERCGERDKPTFEDWQTRHGTNGLLRQRREAES